MLNSTLESLNLTATDQQLSLFDQYIDLLLKWNKTYNLSAIRDRASMLTHHLYDSLSIAPYIKKNHLIDVGSGAGLPGIPLAIMYPEKQVTLLDSNIKKSRFQRQVLLELKLNNVEIIKCRVEDYKPTLLFDAVISRAFSSINDMVKLTEHLLKPDGYYFAMKGHYPHDEISEVYKKNNVDIKVIALSVPNLDAERHLVIIKHLIP